MCSTIASGVSVSGIQLTQSAFVVSRKAWTVRAPKYSPPMTRTTSGVVSANARRTRVALRSPPRNRRHHEDGSSMSRLLTSHPSRSSARRRSAAWAWRD